MGRDLVAPVSPEGDGADRCGNDAHEGGILKEPGLELARFHLPAPSDDLVGAVEVAESPEQVQGGPMRWLAMAGLLVSGCSRDATLSVKAPKPSGTGSAPLFP